VELSIHLPSNILVAHIHIGYNKRFTSTCSVLIVGGGSTM